MGHLSTAFLPIALALPCNVQKLDAHDIKTRKLQDFTQPIIITNMIGNWKSLRAWNTSEKFASRFGHHYINANRTSFAYGRQHVSVKDFSRNAANEHIIVMDDDRITRLEDHLLTDIKKDFGIPTIFENITSSRVLSYGGGFRGVDFMRHCEAWVGIVAGAKMWQFADPKYEDVTTDCENPSTDTRITRCTVFRGDVVYVPPMWWHATCNLEAHTIAVGTQCAGHNERSWANKDEL